MSVPIDRLLSDLRRHAFVPLMFRLSMTLEQVAWNEFAEDPTLASFTLRSGQRLVKADGLVNWFDSWFEAEAAGASVARDALGRPTGEPQPPAGAPDPDAIARSPSVLLAGEIARRLVEESRGRATVLGYLTGGHTLLRTLFGAVRRRRIVEALSSGTVAGEERDAVEATVQLTLRLVRAYCESRVGGLLLAEEDAITSADYLRSFDQVINLARYYGTPLILLGRHPMSGEVRAGAMRAGVNHVVAPGGGRADVVQAMPQDLFAQDRESVLAWLREERASAPARRCFISTWEMESDVAPELLIAAQRELDGAAVT